jgi:hypothetical protein
MNKQPEALRLADLQDAGYCKEWRATAAELRRLHEVNTELLEFAKEWLDRQGTDENYMVMKARVAIKKATGEQK